MTSSELVEATGACPRDQRVREFLLDDPAVAKDPGAFFAELHSACPVARADAHGGFWMLSRYADVHDAALRPEAFSSSAGVIIPVPPTPPLLCLEQDDPEHRSYRRPMQGWFSPARMADLEDAVREIVTRTIDPVIDSGGCDLATALADPVPPLVIAALMGLPAAEWPTFRDGTNALLSLASSGDMAGSAAAVMQLCGYLADKLAERRAEPSDDLLTDIVELEVDGAPVSVEDAISLALLILGAGHETTVGAIGGMLFHLANDTALRDRLLADRSLIPSAVEEALRLESPLMGLGRVAARDIEVGGVPIGAAERVMILFGAANRDASVFERPGQFDVDRTPNRHLAFGVGVHRCVGAPLARLEMRVVLEEVLTCMPGLRLDPDGQVAVDYKFSRAYRRLPVLW